MMLIQATENLTFALSPLSKKEAWLYHFGTALSSFSEVSQR